MQATIHYLRNAARKSEEAAKTLENVVAYKHEKAIATIDSAIEELQLCKRHCMRALEERHAKLIAMNTK